MDILFKLNKEQQAFLINIGSIGVSRSLVTSLALARAIAYQLTPDFTDNENSFRTNHKQSVEILVSNINETVLLDLETVIAYTEKFYNLRIAQFKYSPVLALNPETAVEDFFKISTFIDQAAIKVIKEESLRITEFSNKFYSIVVSLKVA